MSKRGANPSGPREPKLDAKIWSSYLETWMQPAVRAEAELVEPIGIEPMTSSLQS